MALRPGIKVPRGSFMLVMAWALKVMVLSTYRSGWSWMSRYQMP